MSIEDEINRKFEALANRAGDIEFEKKAEDWARNYDNRFWGGGAMNMIAIMMKYGKDRNSTTTFGTPDWQSSAYKFQKIVEALEQTHWRQMMALRNWYFGRDQTMEMRCEAMGKLGITCKKDAFYSYLAQGKALVRKELGL